MPSHDGGICGKSLMAWQNRAMFPANRPLAALAAMSVLALPGCGREPAPTEAWLGPVVDVTAPAAAGARFPHLAAAPAGAPVVMSWLEPGSDGSRYSLRYAAWQEDRRWGPATEVAAGENWFVNWADFPSVVPLDERALAAHWLQQQPGGVYSYDVMTRLSTDDGRTWSAPAAPHDDGTATEHGFVSIANWQGRPYAVWLDGRNTASEGHGHDGHASGDGAMSLRGAVLAAGGARAGSEIDGRVCDCCQTDLAQARDALLVVYRDRSADEVRDIQLARLERGRVVDAGERARGRLEDRRVPGQWPCRRGARRYGGGRVVHGTGSSRACGWRSRPMAVAALRHRSKSPAVR